MISIDTSEFYRSYMRQRYAKRLQTALCFKAHREYPYDIDLIIETADSNDMIWCLESSRVLHPIKIFGLTVQILKMAVDHYASKYYESKHDIPVEMVEALQALVDIHCEMERGRINANVSTRRKLHNATKQLGSMDAIPVAYIMKSIKNVLKFDKLCATQDLASEIYSACLEIMDMVVLPTKSLYKIAAYSCRALDKAISGAHAVGIEDEDIARAIREAIKENL